MNTDQKNMDKIFWTYMAFMVFCMCVFYFAGIINNHAFTKGHTQGFMDGQIAAIHGQWEYAPQLIVTTNWVQTNYVKLVRGIPSPLNVDIRMIKYENKFPNLYNFTNWPSNGMLFSINKKGTNE